QIGFTTLTNVYLTTTNYVTEAGGGAVGVLDGSLGTSLAGASGQNFGGVNLSHVALSISGLGSGDGTVWGLAAGALNGNNAFNGGIHSRFDWSLEFDVASTVQTVPEPTSMALIGLGAAGVLGRRRRARA